MNLEGRKVPPVRTNGVAKVPVILQLEALECGAAALAMVMAYYGKWVPLEQVRIDCGVSRNGSNAKNIYKAAVSYGFEVKAHRWSEEEVKANAQFPCIIHWNMNHFVVLKGFKNNKVYLNDPARGSVVISAKEFDESFTGVVIIPVPGKEFIPSGKPKSALDFTKKRMMGTGGMVVFVMITTALVYLFGVIDSVASKVFLDRLLTGINRDWLKLFILILVMITLVHIVILWIQTIYSLKINGKMAVVGSCAYMWKVLRLPMDFFAQRLAGDIEGRIRLNASIAGTLVNAFAPLFIHTMVMIFYLLLMLKQSPMMTVVGIGTLVLNIVVSRITSGKRINIVRVEMRDAGKLESTTASGIEMIETIKASGAENGFFKKWAGYQASVNSQKVLEAKIDLFWGMIPVFFNTIANYVVLILGVYQVMNGSFTLGMVLMFQGLLASFIRPANMMLRAGQTIHEMRTNMERVEDVMGYAEDVVLREEERRIADQSVAKLKGNIELKNVTFGYAKLDDPLIKDFSLSIQAGERVAIVGASGCGKSTLSKLISGLYMPWSGEILFDGKSRWEYPREVMTGSIAVVDQDIILFADTIAANIRMWDESIKDFEVILAARDAQIHDDILKMPGGYNYRITSGGRDLSGGQRQRMEIARVLAQDPMVIILDEATSALDAQTEYDVVKAIKDRGITCIVIAHRLSTIRDCDKIIVLDHGVIVEQGVHDELMKTKGVYADLIANE